MTLPALRAALICEAVLTEADGVHSAIRMFNRLHLAPGEHFDAKLLLMLATTERSAAEEPHRILIRIEGSDAKIVSGLDFDITSPRDAGETFSLIIPFRFEAPPAEGMFWLRFAYDRDDQLLTRVPMHFRHAVTA